MKEIKIKAVHDHDLDYILENLGLLKALEDGELECSICGRQITRENIFCIYPYKKKIRIACDTLECCNQVLKEREENTTE